MEKAPNDKDPKATYTLKDKHLHIILNGHYLCHSADTNALSKFLEKSL